MKITSGNNSYGNIKIPDGNYNSIQNAEWKLKWWEKIIKFIVKLADLERDSKK